MQAAFRISNNVSPKDAEPAAHVNVPCIKSNRSSVKESTPGKTEVDSDIDISADCLVSDMFGISLSTHEVQIVPISLSLYHQFSH